MCAYRLPTSAFTPAAPRPPHGLNAADAQATIIALQGVTPDWTIDQHEDIDGALMLMLTAPGEEDTTPTFVLTRTGTGTHLAVALGDSCDTLGTFETPEGAARAARHIVEVAAASTMVVA